MALLRLAIFTVAAVAIYLLVRALMRTMRPGPGRHPEISMPFCHKCESNRNVVVNSGQAEDTDLRWYCTRCREGF